MIALKLERIGDQVVLVLDEAALAALNAQVGDTLHVEVAEVRTAVRETWTEDSHARGRAFLRRYRRSFDQLAQG
jgi:hypothetical protein